MSAVAEEIQAARQLLDEIETMDVQADRGTDRELSNGAAQAACTDLVQTVDRLNRALGWLP